MSNDFLYSRLKDVVGVVISPNARQIVIRDFILSIFLFNETRNFRRELKAEINPAEEILFETHTHLYKEFHEEYRRNLDNFLEDIIKRNIGIIAFTDHENDKLFREISKLKRLSHNYKIVSNERSLLVESLSNSSEKLLILKGQEYSDGSHAGLIGYRGSIKQGLSYKKAIEEVHNKGGFAVAVHPLFFRGVLSERWVKERKSPVDVPKLTELVEELTKEPFDFYELNGRLPYFLGVENMFLYSVLKGKVNLLAGSDAHSIKDLGKTGVLINKKDFDIIIYSKDPVAETYTLLKEGNYKILLNN